MNIHLPYFNFTTLMLVVSFIFTLTKLLKNLTKPQSKPENLPPGPPKLPVIGHLHHILGRGLPHQALRKVARVYGPVVHLQLGQVPAVVISSSEAARQVLKSHDPACADRPESIGSRIMWYDHADIVFGPYNEYWRWMRKTCILELLSPNKVRSFESTRRAEAGHLVRYLRSSSGELVNLTERIFAFTSSILCRAVFGKAVVGDCRELLGLLSEGAALAGGFEVEDFFPGFKPIHVLSWNRYKLRRMRRKLDGILDGILEQYRVKIGDFGGEDIVDVLLRMQKNGELQFPITNNNIKAIMFDMISAGIETSSNALHWAMAELLRNPHVMSKAQAEIREAFKGKTTIEESDVQALNYLNLVIKETLRLHPPLPLLRRACREECTVNGYTIPLKSRVLVNIWAMGQDPQYWAEPETFRPERFEDGSVDFLGNNFEFIPFGAGKRSCPGMNLGLVNMELPLAHLLYYFDWKLAHGMGPKDVEVTEAKGLAATRKNDLFLIPLVHGMGLPSETSML